jgi:hypothetical protein
MKAKRKQYSPSFKAKVALEALKDKQTLAEFSPKGNPPAGRAKELRGKSSSL